MHGSCAYVDRNTTQNVCIRLYGIFERKCSRIIYQKWGNMKYKYRNRSFWCRGYYVDTAGKNDGVIRKYIENQLKEDQISEQLTMDIEDPFTGKKQ